MSDDDYRCPNGHEFPRVVAVGCEECDAHVACVPWAEAKRLHDGSEAIGRRLGEARLLGEMWLRSGEHRIRIMGADLLQLLADD